MIDVKQALLELREFEGDEETPKPSAGALLAARKHVFWALLNGFEVEHICPDAMGGIGVYLEGVDCRSVWYCFLDDGSESFIVDSPDEQPRALPDLFSVARYLRGQDDSYTLEGLLKEREERYRQLFIELSDYVPTPTVVQHMQKVRREVRLEGLCTIIDVLLPELLTLAGNGLPLNGERRIRKALGLPPDRPKKATAGRLVPRDKAE